MTYYPRTGDTFVMTSAASVSRVLVVGASLAGLSSALALIARGFEVRVFDKARVFHQGAGTALTLWPNGLRSLSRIDPSIVTELAALGAHRAATVHLRMDGSVLGRTPIEVQATYGFPALIVRWTDLQKVLMDRVPSGVITSHERCVDVVTTEHSGLRQLEVHFESGRVERGDLVLGADGIRSVVRERLFDETPPVYGGRMLWRSIVDGFRHPLLNPNESVFIQGKGGSFGIKHLTRDSAYWSVNQVMESPPPAPAFPLDAEAMRTRVLERLRDFPDIAREMVRHTDLSRHPILEYPVLDHVPLERWTQKGVALLGDAAHAMDPALGQGANLTFEDAVVLADALKDGAEVEVAERAASIDRALADYEARRLFRVHAVQARNAMTVRSLMGGTSDAEDWKRMLHGYAGGGIGKQQVFRVAESNSKEFSDFLFGFDPLPAHSG